MEAARRLKRRQRLGLSESATDEECFAAEEVIAEEKAAEVESKRAAKEEAKAEKAAAAAAQKAAQRRERLGLSEFATEEECEAAEAAQSERKAAGVLNISEMELIFDSTENKFRAGIDASFRISSVN